MEISKKQASLVYSIIQIIIVLLTIALCFYKWELAIIAFVWFFINALTYAKACEWLSIDEYDRPNPRLGLKIMIKSWSVLIPLLAIAVVLILGNCPIIAIIYGVIALSVFCIYQDLILFNF